MFLPLIKAHILTQPIGAVKTRQTGILPVQVRGSDLAVDQGNGSSNFQRSETLQQDYKILQTVRFDRQGLSIR